MNTSKSFINRLKPGIPKRVLLFVAGLVWTFAGGMLLYRGGRLLADYPEYLWIKLFLSIGAGILFYYFMFDKISAKHTARIKSLPHERPCMFSFFDPKSYLMMVLMISMGIGLRMSGLVALKHISLLYVTMGIPLTISAIRFYLNGLFFRKNQ